MLLRSRWAAPSGFIEPCLPSPADRPPSGPGWIHEIKHDGFRLMARRDAAGVRLLTRNGHDWAGRYPQISEDAGALQEVRSFLIDGEAVACDGDGSAVVGPARKPAELLQEIEGRAVDLDGVAGAAVREPLAPTSGISGAPLPEGGSFLNHGHPDRRQCPSSSNDVSLPLKSYA